VDQGNYVQTGDANGLVVITEIMPSRWCSRCQRFSRADQIERARNLKPTLLTAPNQQVAGQAYRD